MSILSQKNFIDGYTRVRIETYIYEKKHIRYKSFFGHSFQNTLLLIQFRILMKTYPNLFAIPNEWKNKINYIYQSGRY